MSLFLDSDTLKSSLSINDDFADEDIDASAQAACDAVEKITNRKFGKDLEDVTRRYSALDPYRLNIRDLAELTSIKTDEDGDGTFEVTWGADDYFLQPLNAPADSEPYTRIDVNLDTGDYRFPRGQSRVQIVGKWGFPTVPQGAVEAATYIFNQLLRRKRENVWGIVNFGDIALRIARHDPHVSVCLEDLGRPKVVES